MDRVRGGVFSGAMVLAGISATLLSALLAIGIRQVTVHASRPVQVTMNPSSGQVAVPEAASPKPSHASFAATSAPAYAPVPNSYVPPRPAPRSAPQPAGHPGTTTGSRSSGGSVAPPAATKSPTPPAKPSATPTPTRPGHGNGHGAANGAGNGNGNGHKH